MVTADLPNMRGGAMDYAQAAVYGRCSSSESTPCSCQPLVQIDPTELRALFCSRTSADKTALRESFAAAPPLTYEPMFARCARLRCSLFDVVLHGGAGDPDMMDSDLCSPDSLAEVLDIALCAHIGARATDGKGAADRHGGRNGGSLRVASLVGSTALTLARILKMLLPLSRMPVLAVGLTLARPAVAASDNAERAGVSMQWCFVERGSSFSAPYEALWAHWMAIVRPAATRLEGSRLDSAPSFAAGCHNDDLAVWARLQHYAERAAAVLFGKQPAGSVSPKHLHLCALIAVLSEVRACVTLPFISSPHLTPLLDEIAVVQRLLFQWFTFLGLRRASSSHCQPSVELSTEIRGIVLERSWLAERSTCSSIGSLRHWLHLVSQWLTLRVLEATLELLPSVVEWEGEGDDASAAETHVLLRGDVDSSWRCSVGLCSCADCTARSAGEKSGLAYLRPSRWMRYRATASAPDVALPELPKEEAVLVRVLERLMKASIGTSDDSRKPPCRCTTAHALLLEPEVHGVIAYRLHLGLPPHKWQGHDSSAADLGAPPTSQRFTAESAMSSAAPPPSRRVCAPAVAALFSWYALDFESFFGRLYRVGRLARRYGSCDIGAADAATPGHADLWSGVVDHAVPCDDDSTGGRSRAHEGPALSLLSRCLLLGMWMSLALVNVDEDVGAVTAMRTIRSQSRASREASPSPRWAWKGTLYYSSRRSVLHVRDWATALHLRYVASCLSIGDDQDMSNEICRGGSLPHGDGRRKACSAAMKLAASIVVSSFARARIAVATAAQARSQLKAQLSTCLPASAMHGTPAHATAGCRGASDTTGDGNRWMFGTGDCDSDGAAATEEEEDECVLLQWCCDSAKEESGSREGDCRVPLARQRQLKERASDADSLPPSNPLCSASLQSSRIDCSVEEFAEVNEYTIHQSPESHTSAPPVEVAQGPPSMAPAAVASLLDLESSLRELQTRCAVSELLWLVGLAEGLARRAGEESEAAAWQRLVSHAQSHGATVEGRRLSGASSTLYVGAVLLHEYAQPPPCADAANLSVSSSTPQTRGDLTSSKAARLEKGETSARSTLCGAEHRMRQHVQACCAHIGALLRLQGQEASQRLRLSQAWALGQEELQIRWSTVLVPECLLRSLLAEMAAADARRTLALKEDSQPRRQGDACESRSSHLGCAPARHLREQRGMASAPLSGDARAHRLFLMCGEAEEVDREASGCRSRPIAGSPHVSSPCQKGRQDPQTPPLPPPCAPPLAVQPHPVLRQVHANESTVRVPVSPCARAASAHSSVPVFSLSLREAPVRASARRCLSELAPHHSRIHSGLSCSAPSHRLESPRSNVTWRWPLAAAGGALVHRESQERKTALLRDRGARGDEAARRRSSAGAGASMAVAEATPPAAAVKCNSTGGECAADLGSGRPDLSIAEERKAPHAHPRIHVTPAVCMPTTTYVARATSVPSRRLHKPVVTWLEDVRQC
ncbi:hypothetical protein LSCM1_04859 [Leishmania martiniquensis]|uniref:Uncharacterized protein n=1 Tax=Leishmania martiniquensis TaxID=1580590 RepID=A0A836GXW7_9TRYP|nr:hypothetical protein LSCM1_04859 [Leishmania martiniquensis]